MMDQSSGQCSQDNDTSKYNEEDSLDPRIQVMSDIHRPQFVLLV